MADEQRMTGVGDRRRRRHLRMAQFCIALTLALFGLPWVAGVFLPEEASGSAQVELRVPRQAVVEALVGPTPLPIVPGDEVVAEGLREVDVGRYRWTESLGNSRFEVGDDRTGLPERYVIRLEEVESSYSETIEVTLRETPDGTRATARQTVRVPWTDWRGPYRRFAMRFLGGPTHAMRRLLTRVADALGESEPVVR